MFANLFSGRLAMFITELEALERIQKGHKNRKIKKIEESIVAERNIEINDTPKVAAKKPSAFLNLFKKTAHDSMKTPEDYAEIWMDKKQEVPLSLKHPR